MSHRIERVAEEIRHKVAEYLLTQSTQQNTRHITITHVDVTADLSIARVYYTALCEGEELRKSQKILRLLSPLMRTEIAKTLNMRRTPTLQFRYDEQQQEAQRMDELFVTLSKSKIN